nr:2525_t:CDS:2 [Entrophospora candida]
MHDQIIIWERVTTEINVQSLWNSNEIHDDAPILTCGSDKDVQKKIEQTNQPEPEDDRSVYNEIDDTLMTLRNRTSYLPDLVITDDSFLLEVYDKDAITQVRLIAGLIVSRFQSYLVTLILEAWMFPDLFPNG